LHLHEAIEGVKFGGIGPGISPATALALGLKVDLDALPPSLVQQIKLGKVNLNRQQHFRATLFQQPQAVTFRTRIVSVMGSTKNKQAKGATDRTLCLTLLRDQDRVLGYVRRNRHFAEEVS
jgi:hypothetical protein